MPYLFCHVIHTPGTIANLTLHNAKVALSFEIANKIYNIFHKNIRNRLRLFDNFYTFVNVMAIRQQLTKEAI